MKWIVIIAVAGLVVGGIKSCSSSLPKTVVLSGTEFKHEKIRAFVGGKQTVYIPAPTETAHAGEMILVTRMPKPKREVPLDQLHQMLTGNLERALATKTIPLEGTFNNCFVNRRVSPAEVLTCTFQAGEKFHDFICFQKNEFDFQHKTDNDLCFQDRQLASKMSTFAATLRE